MIHKFPAKYVLADPVAWQRVGVVTLTASLHVVVDIDEPYHFRCVIELTQSGVNIRKKFYLGSYGFLITMIYGVISTFEFLDLRYQSQVKKREAVDEKSSRQGVN